MLSSVLVSLVLAFPGAGANKPAESAIANDLVRVAVDAEGRLVELRNLASGQNYAGGQPLWRLFYSRPGLSEAEALAPAAAPRLTVTKSTLAIRYENLETLEHKRLEIGLELQANLAAHSDEVHWSATIDNRQTGVTVTELQYPMVGDCQLPADHALIWSNIGGQRFANPKAEVRQRRTLYMAPDQNGVKMGAVYPGHAALNAYVFAGGKSGLYFGSHDPTLQTTLHYLRLLGDQLQAGFVKYPHLATGGKFTCNDYVLAPYSGTWHAAADKYRRWANCWFTPPAQPEWIRRMAGWQRLIMKHQYGEVLQPYSALPQMYRDGQAAGITSLLLFGWWDAGMDAGYPNYAFDEAQGGRPVLAQQIDAVRRQGAKVHLYFNGRLIDKESEFYRSGEASQIDIKDLRGNEVNESYHFSGNGTTVWQYGRKTFVIACTASKSWQRRRLEWIDQALDLGVDAVFFDQLGIDEVPCTDPRHGHPVPLVNASPLRQENLREIRQHIKARNPQAAFGTEIICDVVAAHADYLHGLTGATGPTGFLEWFRYAFPEVIISDREIRDDTDIQRRVNLDLIRGLRHDVEIYRCRATIAAAPHYQAYLGRVNEFRRKYAEFFLEGLYRDTQCFSMTGNAVAARSFQQGDRLLVALTQSEQSQAATTLRVPGYRLLKTDGMGQYRAESKGPDVAISLGKYGVAVALFEKVK